MMESQQPLDCVECNRYCYLARVMNSKSYNGVWCSMVSEDQRGPGLDLQPLLISALIIKPWLCAEIRYQIETEIVISTCE